jgi:hypothetical protein
MRLPRVRLNVRQAMIAVAVASVPLLYLRPELGLDEDEVVRIATAELQRQDKRFRPAEYTVSVSLPECGNATAWSVFYIRAVSRKVVWRVLVANSGKDIAIYQVDSE